MFGDGRKWFTRNFTHDTRWRVFVFCTAFAINCYICDSTVNPKCANLTDRAMKPEVSVCCIRNGCGGTGMLAQSSMYLMEFWVIISWKAKPQSDWQKFVLHVKV